MEPELETLPVKTVLCPRCGMACSLMPLHRPGAYRLVDPDGHGHSAVCIASAPAPRPVIRYRPVPPAERQPINPVTRYSAVGQGTRRA